MQKQTEDYHLVRVSLDDMDLGYIARDFNKSEFDENVKKQIRERVKNVLAKNSDLLKKYDKTAILFFKLSYSKIAELIQNK